jgi:hypothetical protein
VENVEADKFFRSPSLQHFALFRYVRLSTHAQRERHTDAHLVYIALTLDAGVT